MKETKTIKSRIIERYCDIHGIDKIQECDMHICGHIIVTKDNIALSTYNNEMSGSTKECIIDEETNCLQIIRKEFFPCEECKQEMIKQRRMYCDQFKPVGFDGLLLYHGTQAYYKCTDEEAIQRIRNINENINWQICSSTRPIGNIGIAIKAEVLCASNADLCSQIEKDTGRRYIPDYMEQYRAQYIINNINELDETKWSHTEMITTNNVIEYVWVSNKAPEEIKINAMNLAYELNVGYLIVDNALITK